MNKYDLIVVSYEPFPYGNAATNRMLSYLTGLAEEKNILYLCMASPSQTNSHNKEQKGIYRNIEFRYITKPVFEKRRSLFLRALSLFWRYVMLFFLLLSYDAKSVLLYSSKFFLNKIVQFVCCLKKENIYIDRTELTGYNFSTETSALLKFKRDMECFSGLIVISSGIFDFFDNIQPNRKFLLPVLVDMSRFTQQKREKYFFCCSGANLERDGLLDSLKGFLLFCQIRKDYVLRIATSLNLNDSYHRKCKEIMEQYPEFIHYLGHLPSFEIPDQLGRATALMLTPHTNYKTKGFPTKLGEYLASGTPVVCSSIDDLMAVVSDKTAYIVPPNSPEQIANALQTIVNNEEQAKNIASKGKQLMVENYTIKSYKEKLIDFLKMN